MNRKWPLFVGALLALFSEARADVLQFTNLTSVAGLGSTNHLDAVAYGGGANFIVVGTNSVSLLGAFGPASFSNTNAAKSAGFGAISNLTSAAFGNGIYIASGTSNYVFTSGDGSHWSTNTKAFPYTFDVEGIAANGTGAGSFFAAVSQGLGITRAPAALPLVWNTNIVFTNTFNPGNPASLYEGFKSVATFGANGFVTCGLGGVIRVSTDGGITWNLLNPYNFSAPTLSGVVAAGNQIVCVGAKGANGKATILVGSPNSQNWTAITNASVPQTNLNAIVYTGSTFIATGDGGTIVTSVDATNWQSVPVNSPTTANLTGAFFVSTNTPSQLSGLAILAGSAGTIIVGGTPPPPPSTNSDGSSSQTACAGTAPAINLSVNPVITPYNPSITIDWFDAPTGGNLIATNTTFLSPVIQFAVVTNYYAQSRDNRTGFISTNRTEVTLTVHPRPTSTITSFTVPDFCSGTNSTINVQLTGTGPWTVMWSDGLTETAPNSNYMRTVNPTTTPLVTYTTNYFITALDDANHCNADTNNLFPGDISGMVTLTVTPRPTAAFANINVADFCSGSNTAINVQLTGTSPWTVTWSDGTVATVSTSNYTRTVFPTTTPLVSYPTNYFIAALSDANCSAVIASNDISGTASFMVNPRPTAALTSINVADFCSGSNTTLNVQLTGTAPWSILWSDGTSTNVSTPLYQRVVTPTTTATAPYLTNYFIAALSDANCSAVTASNDMTGRATIQVNPRPTATFVNINVADFCSGSNTAINVHLTGTAPWSVTWSDGTVTNVSTASYTRIVNPTTDTVISYITNYSITALSDANCVAVAASNDISGTATLIVNPRPTSSFTSFSVADFCSGSNTTVNVQLTGTSPWTVTWSDGLVTNVTANTFSRTLNPTTTSVSYLTNFFIAALNDANCSGVAASNDMTGTATFMLNPRPTARFNSFTNTGFCDVTGTNISVQLTGVSPWSILWSDGLATNVSTSNYIRTVFPTSTGTNSNTTNYYSIVSVSDANCSAVAASNDISGLVALTPSARPTATLQPLGITDSCSGTTNTLTVNLTGTGPWKLTWSDGTKDNNVSTSNYTRNVHPTTTALTSYTTNYFIASLSDRNCSAVASDLIGTNTFQVDPLPNAALAGNNTICKGATTPLVTTMGGSIGPWDVTYAVLSSATGSSNFTVTITNSPFTNFLTLDYAITNAVTNTYNIISAVDNVSQCPAPVSGLGGTVTIIVHTSAPQPTNVVNGVTCPGFTPYPPLSVSVPSGVKVNWYDSQGNQVAANTTNYSPVGPAMPTNTMASNYTFYAESVASASVGGCTNTNRVAVVLTVKDCSTPLSIQLLSTNVVLQWPGDRDLQITNALPQGTNTNGWVTIATGIFGQTNFWTNDLSGSGNYFRLFPFP